MNFTPANGTLIRAAGMGNILTTGTITDDSVSTAKLQTSSVSTTNGRKASTSGYESTNLFTFLNQILEYSSSNSKTLTHSLLAFLTPKLTWVQKSKSPSFWMMLVVNPLKS